MGLKGWVGLMRQDEGEGGADDAGWRGRWG